MSVAGHPHPHVTSVKGQLLLLPWQVVVSPEAKKMKETLSKYGVDKSIYDGNQVALVKASRKERALHEVFWDSWNFCQM